VSVYERTRKREITVLTFEQIKELIEQVAERRLQGLEVERSGFRLKIEGQAPPAPQIVAAAPAEAPRAAAPAPPAAAAAAPGPTAPPAAEPEAGAAEASEEASEAVPENAHVLTSPIVGTFYRRPSPEADPFVEVGARVRQGQVLCIVEAMKLMNEIESDVDGVIVEIFPQNAQPVEFEEPLFAIRAE
jgi:acetyl-CoA carboxylase biotin carboxyl carrier protein